MPSTSTVGDWLRRHGNSEGLFGIKSIKAEQMYWRK